MVLSSFFVAVSVLLSSCVLACINRLSARKLHFVVASMFFSSCLELACTNVCSSKEASGEWFWLGDGLI